MKGDEVPKWHGKMTWTSVSIWLWGLLAFFMARSNHYFISNKRVYAKFGLISKKTFDIPIDNIQGVIVKQGFKGRILNHGDIIFSTSGQYAGSTVFAGVSDPYKIKGIVDNIIEINKKRSAVIQKIQSLEGEYELDKISEEQYQNLKSKYEKELQKYE
ncbi:PH domain-containing protein [Methanococcus aeolicus]|uniref:PH domain-containing protein n=1 Tax=Methanococcus aeolicus TaxID=42879 RepID=UPI0021C9B4BE|nr:PH domain-containing protein [Methanococcus aeolicus]UXM84707.1 PH domain-containing protein [Methanococcus aeolicus]